MQDSRFYGRAMIEQQQGKIRPSHTNGAKGNEHIPHPDKLVGHVFPQSKYSITPQAVALYNLAIGAARNEPTDPKQLSFVYENSEGFQPLPTMGVIFAFSAMMGITSVPDLNFNPMMLLHGEQLLKIKKPIPTEGVLTNHAKIKALYDKGKGAVLVIEADSKDEKNDVVVHNEYSVFIRGIGGFGGDRGPSGETNVPPNRAPDAVHKETTARNEALLYRLASGDMNPLHADPSMAAIGGMERPILHGLCSFGYASRAVLQHYCDNDPARFKSVQVRFAKHVFPGETLITEMWLVAPNKVVFRTKVEERGEYCITNAAVEIVASPSSGGATATAQPAGEFKAAPVFASLEKALHAGGVGLVKKVNGIYHFHITGGPGGQSRSWGIDLKNGSEGKLVQGKPEGTGVTLTLSDEDFALLFTGKLDSQTAFMQGRLKISGDMGLAMKLGELTKSQAKL